MTKTGCVGCSTLAVDFSTAFLNQFAGKLAFPGAFRNRASVTRRIIDSESIRADALLRFGQFPHSFLEASLRQPHEFLPKTR